jgi:uncharacterized protein YycO
MSKIHFVASSTPGGLIIRLFTFSRWNHVAIEVDGVVFEALSGGVQEVAAKDYIKRWKRGETVPVDVPDKAAAVSFLRDQLGKRYDFGALLALPFRKNWHTRDRWFCSELVAAALEQGGRPKMRIKSYRVTPRDLWLAL